MANGAPRCHPANRPFHDRLEKLRLDCGCKGYYSQEKTYSRALQAVRRYPLPLRSTHEVADLDGMGKACARIFEEIRQKQEPVGQEAEDEWRKCAKQRLLKALSSKAKVSRREAKGLKPQSSVAQPKSGRPRGRGGKGRGGRGKGRGKGGGKTWDKGRSKCSKGSEGSGGAADRHADIEEDDQPLSQLLNPSTPDRSQSSKPFVALTPPSRAHQATPATSPEPTQVASQRSWLEIPEPLTPTLVMRSPLTGGCELLASALASAPASQDSQSGELHVEPVNLGDEGAPSTKKPPVRNLRRAASAPEGPKPKRALVQTRSEPEPRHLARLASRKEPLELRSFSVPGKLVLLLDHREVGASKEHALKGAMLSELQKRLGVEAVEARVLPLGDVLWIWRNEKGEELVAGWIVERKTFADLSSSILDGRYEEQKGRLLEAPNLEGVIFLIEGSGALFGVEEGPSRSTAPGGSGRGFGQRLAGPRLCEKALSSSASHTQLISGFNVLHSLSTPHSIALLAALHKNLEKQRCSEGHVSYEDFAERTKKHGQRRVFEAFGRMLRVVPGCGAEATEALVDEFQTPQAFATALRDFSDAELLQRLKRHGRVTRSALAACRALFAG
ncbi:unnamed protein product [Durusdinium trenchii]|uniref:Crossover junction endonuclease MUS81 n=1 Tax=Durusdinium trenchii TaxID=1381693 RepID=A0ABP0LZQ6_9DINO